MIHFRQTTRADPFFSIERRHLSSHYLSDYHYIAFVTQDARVFHENMYTKNFLMCKKYGNASIQTYHNIIHPNILFIFLVNS